MPVCVVCSSSTSVVSGEGDNSSCQEHPQANWRREKERGEDKKKERDGRKTRLYFGEKSILKEDVWPHS